MSTLFLVATPIGNMGDLTPRAKEVLGSCSLVACEDTRRTGGLLQQIGARTPTWRLDEHAVDRNAQRVLDELDAGQDVAVVSDAGSPVVADPGARIVAIARAAGHTISPIPGVSAVTAALSVCGFAHQQFWFAGFMPRKKAERQAMITAASIDAAVVVFLSPHRVDAEIAALAEAWPDRRATICRELTKVYEQVEMRTLREWQSEPPIDKGEFVIVLEPIVAQDTSTEEMVAWIHRLSERGLQGRALADTVSEITGLARRLVIDAMRSEGIED